MEFNYVDRYIKRKSKECRQSTLDQYKSTIVRFLSGIATEKNIQDEMKLYKSINNDTIEDFYEVYSDTHKKSCENNSISIIRQFFDYLVEDKGLYKSNPFGAIKGYKPHVIQQSVKEKDLLTKEEMIAFINELSVPYPDEKCFEFNSKRNQFLFSLMATGRSVMSPQRFMKFLIFGINVFPRFQILIFPSCWSTIDNIIMTLVLSPA